MTGSVLNRHPFSMRQRRTLCFALCWCCGLLTGTLFAGGAEPALLALMRRAVSCRVSIVLLFLSAILPFLITAYAVCINKYLILFTAGFLKALSFSYCAFVVYRAMGSAGWLVQPMFQFSDVVLSGAFCWFCLRCCMAAKPPVRKDLMICFILAAIVVIIDYLFVSRFLASLIDY